MVFILEKPSDIELVSKSLDKDELNFILKTNPKIKTFESTGRVYLFWHINENTIAIPGNFYDEAHHGSLIFLESCKSHMV